MRSGADYLEAMRDGRTVYLDGELVSDVTRHTAFSHQIRLTADTYDALRARASSDGLSHVDEAGKQISNMWLIPRSSEDLARRRAIHAAWAEPSFGHIGRSPDHVACTLTAFAASADLFAEGRQEFASNVLRFYERARDQDLYVAYVIVPPSIDRSKPAHQQSEPFLYAGAVDERDDGIVVRGAQMLATSATMADYLFLSYIVPLQPGDDAHAISVALPIDTPGLKLYPRRPYALQATSVYDYPLSSRFDEIDSIAVFDDVFVPWDHVFVYRDIGLTRRQWSDTGAHVLANYQALCRFVVKLAFAAGLARELCEESGLIALPPVQAQLGGQVATICSTLEGVLLAAEREPVMLDGLALPNPQFVYSGMSLQRRLITDLMRSLREFGGGSIVATPSSFRSFTSPDTRDDMKRYFRGGTSSAEDRIKLVKLYWDFVGSEFASRQTQYEMFYSAGQHVVDGRVFGTFDWSYGRSLVEHCLGGYGLPDESEELPAGAAAAPA